VKRPAICLVLALVTMSPRAFAYGPDAQPEPDPEPTSDQPAPASSSRPLAGRLAALASYRRLYDLSMLGGGIGLSLGPDVGPGAIMFNMRFIDARTPDGLVVLEGGVSAAFEWHLGRGWSAGGGVGFEAMRVHRVTIGTGDLFSLGPMALARVAYDFGDRPNVYVLVDLEAQWQADGAVPWGPTLQVGLRF
jgi:hypothetical protein